MLKMFNLEGIVAGKLQCQNKNHGGIQQIVFQTLKLDWTFFVCFRNAGDQIKLHVCHGFDPEILTPTVKPGTYFVYIILPLLPSLRMLCMSLLKYSAQ